MAIDYAELKKGGFLKQKQSGNFIMRLRTVGGNLTAEQLAGVTELAKKYGRGYVHLTTRQGVEIPWVALENFDGIRNDMKKLNLLPGTCGPRIRTVVSCPGTDVCGFALMDSQRAAATLDRTFFGREVPIKTKIGVSGCPNSCSKPQENDIGFKGAVEPAFNPEVCTGCGLCARICPAKALKMVGDKPEIDRSKCIHEGNCISSCPADAWQAARSGFHLYAGGKIGRFPQLGVKIAEFVPEEELVETVEKVLAGFRVLAQKGERIANVINRVGADVFRRTVFEQGEKTECAK